MDEWDVPTVEQNTEILPLYDYDHLFSAVKGDDSSASEAIARSLLSQGLGAVTRAVFGTTRVQ
jgi:hypothetical protein